jgi:hypothetical protein
MARTSIANDRKVAHLVHASATLCCVQKVEVCGFGEVRFSFLSPGICHSAFGQLQA